MAHQLIIIAANRLTGIVGGEPYFEARVNGRTRTIPFPEHEGRLFWGYGICSREPSQHEVWTVSVATRSSDPMYVERMTCEFANVDSYLLQAGPSHGLARLSDCVIVIDRQHLVDFKNCCDISKISYQIEFFSGEIIISKPPERSLAA